MPSAAPQDIVVQHTAARNLMPAFSINIDETFEHLPHAPITEAIIQIRGRVIASWEEASTLAHLKSVLPDYPQADSQHTFKQQISLIPAAAPSSVIDRGWTGGIFRNTSGTQVANFQRDAFSFSRLAPYETWAQFSTEALRLYRIHAQHGLLAEAQRIGLRFINQFDAPTAEFSINDFFTQPLPVSHTELPLTRALFFHRDTFMVPGHAYGVTVTRTFQPANTPPAGPLNPKLILDIDVFTTSPTPADPVQVHARLKEMRWLKNKLFFGSLTFAAIARFR